MEVLEDMIEESKSLDMIGKDMHGGEYDEDNIEDEDDTDDGADDKDSDNDEESEDEEHEDEAVENETSETGREDEVHVNAKDNKEAQVAPEIQEERNSTSKGYPWMIGGCDLSEDCSIENIQESRGCGKTYFYNAYRNETEWALMRSTSMAIVGPEASSIELEYGSGIEVPFKVAHSPGRGRGVFATSEIPKGTLVWTSKFTATFTSGVQFRKFLSILPDDMVCDLIIWCYASEGANDTEDIQSEAEGNTSGQDFFECDLDEASLFNSYDRRSEYNLGSQKGTVAASPDDDKAYAIRDFRAGEELVTAYEEFDTMNYEAFGLL